MNLSLETLLLAFEPLQLFLHVADVALGRAAGTHGRLRERRANGRVKRKNLGVAQDGEASAEGASADATRPGPATEAISAVETTSGATEPVTAEAHTDELIELPAPREPESAKQKTAAPASA